MTAERLDLMLSAYFEELAAAPAPDDLLGRVGEATADRSPRPGWLARMPHGTAIRLAGRPMTMPQVGRVAALAMIAAALLVAGTIVAAMALRQAFPSPAPPFGPARNGAIAYTIGEDLYLGDIESGRSHLVAAGVGIHPVLSRDGTKVATVRFYAQGTRDRIAVDPCYQRLSDPVCDFEAVVTTVDGAVLATLAGVPDQAYVEGWTSDGKAVLVRGRLPQPREGWTFAKFLYPIDGSPPTKVSDGQAIWLGAGPVPLWRSSYDDATDGTSLVPLDLRGQPAGAPIPLPGSFDADAVAMSPDGSRVAVVSLLSPPETPEGVTPPPIGRLVVLRTDGTIERVVPTDHGLQTVQFSPDGKWLVVGLTDDIHWTSVVIPADGTWAPVLLVDGATLLDCQWSPDGSRLACLGERAVWLVDPVSGVGHETSWSRDLLPFPVEWQRLAP